MKSIKIFATVGAIALLGMTGFTSCNQNNTPVGPENLKDGEVVKTEFSIAIPEVADASASGRRYMPALNVQKDGNFRGMKNIFLIPYAKTSGEPASPVRGGNNITLTDIANTDLNAKGAKVYTNVSIPLGTKSFLFYGEAAGTVSTDAEKHQYGVLEAKNTDGAPSGIAFELQQINQATPATNPAIADKGLITYLNGILATTDNQTPAKAWYDYASVSPALASIYDKFVSLSAGSSYSIQCALKNLVMLLEAYEETGADTYGLVENIENKIRGAENADATLTITGTVAGNDLSVSLTLNDAHQGFPGNVGLPDGAASLSYDSGNHVFALNSTSNANGMTLNTNDSHHGLTNFVYPASLYYFVDSKIRVSNASQASNYTDVSKDWADFLTAYYGSADGEVSLTTRSVAITDQIQYAVGRMDLQVMIASSPLYYDDPMETAIPASGNKSYATTGIPVTAVLIGGQKNVDYKFEPNGEISYTIYDNAVPATGSPAVWEAPVGSYTPTKNYTLALQTAVDEKVLIALELENNMGDFYGQGGELIPYGSKFYLVGELDPTKGNHADTRYANTEGRVFMQDFFTEVSLTLSQTSLKQAYNTIPDLRATKLELGLSVNLQWREGMTFNVVF